MARRARSEESAQMIAVSNVSMRYGSKVLFDDVSTTFSPGRRYGLTGPNGAGKSTFMKLLTGELQPQKGTVSRPARLGVLRQDQFAFDAHPRHRHRDHGQRRLWAALAGARPALRQADADRRGRHAARRARRHRRRGRRLFGRERRRDPAGRARHPRRAARADDGGAAGRPEGARAAGAGAVRASAGAAARRADQPPRPRLDPLAARVPGPLRRHADRHLARPPLPERGLHAHRRHRLPDDHHLHRRLRRHGRRQDADPVAARIAERAAREEDRAAERLHRALLGRHALEPGAVAAQGSRAAADDRPGAVEHPAPVHPLPDEAAVGPHGVRVRRASPRRTAATPSSPASTRSSTAARRSCWSAATASARRRCSRRCWPTRRDCRPSPGDIDRGTGALGPRGVDRLLPAGSHRR